MAVFSFYRFGSFFPGNVKPAFSAGIATLDLQAVADEIQRGTIRPLSPKH